jgi:hypothetical protein
LEVQQQMIMVVIFGVQETQCCRLISFFSVSKIWSFCYNLCRSSLGNFKFVLCSYIEMWIKNTKSGSYLQLVSSEKYILCCAAISKCE